MIRIMERSVRSYIPLGQVDGAHVMAPGSIGSGNPPTSLACGSEAATVVDEGTLDLAGHETDLRFRPCLPRCTDSDTKTQPSTMLRLVLTEEDQTISGWRRRVSVPDLSMVCWYV